METEVERKRIRKVDLLIFAGLVTILVVTVWFYIELQRERNLSNDLQNQVSGLQNELSYLNATYLNYVSTHTHTNSEYDNYVADHQYTDSEHEDYVDNHQYTNAQYENYVATHQYTNSEYDEALFFFYYVKPEEQEFGVYNLDAELSGIVWDKPYEEDVFDCSEMSASLE